MAPQTVTLFEYQSKTYADLGWTPDDARIARLETLVAQAKTPIFSFGRYALKAGHFVGVVRVDELTLQILPKIDYAGSSDERSQGEVRRLAEHSATRNLFTLLSYTHNIQLSAQARAALETQSADWFELMIHLFASELYAQLRQGLEHSYIQYEDSLAVIRGRWQVARQLAHHPYVQHRFDVTFDEFSPDTPLNQVFRYVTRALLQLTKDKQNRRALQDIYSWLEAIPQQAQPVQTLQHRIHFSRLNERFQPAYRLACLFLESLVFQLSAGSHETFAFVLDMNVLFERFVAAFLHRHWKRILPDRHPEVKIVPQSQGKTVHLANMLHPSGKPVFQLIPDLQFTSLSGRPRLIADTKYKQLSPRERRLGVAESDLYQMLAYAIRFDCPRLQLLYPQSEAGQIRAVLQIQDQPQMVWVATLNLQTPLDPPETLIAELREILTSSFPH